MKLKNLFSFLFLLNISFVYCAQECSKESKFKFCGYVQLDSKEKLEFGLEDAKAIEKTNLHDKYKQAFINKYRNILEKLIAPGCESILLKTDFCHVIRIYTMPNTERFVFVPCNSKFSLDSNIVRVCFGGTEKNIDITNVNDPKIIDEKIKIQFAPPILSISFANKKIIGKSLKHHNDKGLLSEEGPNHDDSLTLTKIRIDQFGQKEDIGLIQTFSPNQKYILIASLFGQFFIGDISSVWKINDFNLSQVLFLIELVNIIRFENLSKKEMLEIFNTFSPEVKEHLNKFIRKIRVRNEISDITKLDLADKQANLSQLIADFVE